MHLPLLIIYVGTIGIVEWCSRCVFLSVHALKGKRLQLPVPKLLEM